MNTTEIRERIAFLEGKLSVYHIFLDEIELGISHPTKEDFVKIFDGINTEKNRMETALRETLHALSLKQSNADILEIKQVIENHIKKWASNMEETGVLTWGDALSKDIIDEVLEKFIINKK